MAERGPIALASSTPHRLIHVVLEQIGLEGAFDVICSAEDEHYGKPHPAVFLSAASALRTSPERCCVFEDSPAGVLAAKAARMLCVAVPEASEASSAIIGIADVIVDSLEDLDLEALDQLLVASS
jgi:sugar-phosphatase